MAYGFLRHHALTVVVPEGDAVYLRRLNNAREHIRERNALLNQLQQLVFLIFPEFETVIKDIKIKTARYILRSYTTPQSMGVLNKETLGEEMRKTSMGKFGIKDAEALIGLAQGTVGIKEGITGLDLDVKHILIQLETIESFIAEIESKMEGTLS